MVVKYVLSEAQIQFIRDNYQKLSQGKLATILGIPISAIKYRVKVLGLSSPRPFVKKRTEWTEAETQMLKTYYPIRSNAEVLAMLPGKTERQLYAKACALKISKDKEFRAAQMRRIYHNSQTSDKFKSYNFKKGHVAHNKGVPMPEDVKEKVKHSWFKKGHENSPNALYDGAITIRTDMQWGRVQFIRLAKCKWIPLHQYVWLQAGNELKKGHVIAFKDGNTNNVDIENLEQISRAELLSRNSIINYGKEYQSQFLVLAHARIKVNRFKQQLLKRQNNGTETN